MITSDTPEPWLATALAQVRSDPSAMPRLFGLAARKGGRGPLRPDVDPQGVVYGSVEDDARAQLVRTWIEVSSDPSPDVVADLYWRGDSAERRGVLRALDAVVAHGDELPAGVVKVGLECAADALRANEADLVAAAVGPFAARNMDAHSWRHAVLKLIFMGISLDAVADLDTRKDDELARMAHDFAGERRAAGRPVPADVARLTSEGIA